MESSEEINMKIYNIAHFFTFTTENRNLIFFLNFIEIESLVFTILVTIFLCISHNLTYFGKYFDEYKNIKRDFKFTEKELLLEEIEENSEKVTKIKKCIAVKGLWYDVTDFISSHPGGDIIDKYIGYDVSSTFYGMHKNPEKILKYRIPIARVKDFYKKAKNVDLEYIALHNRYTELGLFEPSMLWVIKMFLINFTEFFVALYCVFNFPYNWFFNGLLIGYFFNLCAFVTHDSGHRIMFKTKFFDDLIAWFFGNVCFGVSGTWWREEHDLHHAVPNSFDENGIYDKQANEDIWCQNERILKFFKCFHHKYLIKFQHILFVPIILLFARHGIMVDCYKDERRPVELLGLILHISWLYYVLKLCTYPLLTYFIAGLYQSLLGLQLVSNHYYNDWEPIEKVGELSFPERQIKVNVNVANSPYTDWFYGGLQFHNEHHCFPKMPRYNLRFISEDLKKLLESNNIEYKSESFLIIIYKIIMHFKKVSEIKAQTSECNSSKCK